MHIFNAPPFLRVGSRLTRPRTIRPCNLDFSFCSIESSFSQHLFSSTFHVSSSRRFLPSTPSVLFFLSLSTCRPCKALFDHPMAMTDPVNNWIRHGDILFATTQRGRDVPVINGYIFFPKDKERKRFKCRTKNCRASITVREDADGQYYTPKPTHNHPPHDVFIRHMENHNKLKQRVISKSNSRPQTLEIALEHRQEFPTSRRLSTDLRFIRRIRQGNVVPKSFKDIDPDDLKKDTMIFRSHDNAVMVFGSSELLTAATSTTRVCIDGTFSRCPKTHFQLLTCHAVCSDGFAFPFAFALLTNKKAATYLTVFNEIDRKAVLRCGNPVFSRDDNVVSCDFEKINDLLLP